MASVPKKPCKDLSLRDSLRAILKCPHCSKVCYSPMFMCINEHLVCNECQPTVTTCKICGVDGKPTVRWPDLEKIAVEVKIMPCANKRKGCAAVLNAADMAKHWETCKEKYSFGCWVFMSASAASTRCKWTGSREGLVAHVEEKHAGCYTQDDVIQCVVDISLTETVDYTRLVSAHRKLFWVEFLYIPNQNCAYILSRYIGKKENAVNFRGKFAFSSRDGCIETTCVVDTRDLNTAFVGSSSTKAIRLFKPNLEECMLEGVFSFTAQIL